MGLFKWRSAKQRAAPAQPTLPEPPELRTCRRHGEEVELRVGNQFVIGNKIDSGSFGDVYEGYCINTSEPVVIKLEARNAKHPQLLYEARLSKILHGGGTALGIPRLLWYGIEGGFFRNPLITGEYYAMVMEMLDWSLEHLFNYCGRTFTLKTVLMLGEQLVSRLEFLHSKNFLHRDVKPDNFLMGLGPSSHVVYLLDFGLAKRYRDSTTLKHIPPKEGKNFTGTARYASVNAHEGREQSRRDDMESLGYVLIYFLTGSLPWQNIKAETHKERCRLIMEMKSSISADVLCKSLPEEFRLYMVHIKSLNFEEKPDYSYLRKLFRDLYRKAGLGTMDHQYDWTVKRTLDAERRKKESYRMVDPA